LPVVQANVYVDGFSLYYSALKGTPHKWLDLQKLCRLLLPNDRIHRIRYFTAIPVYQWWRDAPKGQRLQAYVRALETLRGLTVHYGACRADSERMPISGARAGENERVIRRLAKGSDVNLASMLLMDGFRRDYEVAVLITTDSDLALPMRLVRTRLQLPVGLLKPGEEYANELVRAATFWKPIREGVLAASQLPAQLTDEHGTITKPSAW
jgi:NYN domain